MNQVVVVVGGWFQWWLVVSVVLFLVVVWWLRREVAEAGGDGRREEQEADTGAAWRRRRHRGRGGAAAGRRGAFWGPGDIGAGTPGHFFRFSRLTGAITDILTPHTPSPHIHGVVGLMHGTGKASSRPSRATAAGLVLGTCLAFGATSGTRGTAN